MRSQRPRGAAAAPAPVALQPPPVVVSAPPSPVGSASGAAALSMARRASRLESAVIHLASPQQRQQAVVEMLGLKLAPHQRGVRAKLEEKAREVLREHKQGAPFVCPSVDGGGGESNGNGNNGSTPTKLYDPHAFQVRTNFFDPLTLAPPPVPPTPAAAPTTNGLVAPVAVPAIAPAAAPTSASGSAAAPATAPAAPATPAEPQYPLADQHAPALPQSGSFTTAFSVPSLRKQLPPPVVPPQRLQGVRNPAGAGTAPPMTIPGLATSIPGLLQQLTAKHSTLTPEQVTDLVTREMARQKRLQQHQQQLQRQATNPQNPFTVGYTSTPASPPALPPPAPMHLQQLNAIAAAQLTVNGNTTPHPVGSAAAAYQQAQLQALLKLYEQQNRAMMGGPSMAFPSPSPAVMSVYARYERQRADKIIADRAKAVLVKDAKDKRRLRKYFLSDLLKRHYSAFQSAAKERKKAAKVAAYACAKIELDIERKKAVDDAKAARMQLREAEARLAALKSNDLVAYAALIKDCKSQRIQLLLQQTAKWEEKLKAMIATKKKAGELEEKAAEAKERAKKALALAANPTSATDATSAATAAAATAPATAAAPLAPAAASSADASSNGVGADAPASPAAAAAASEVVLDESTLLQLEEEKVTQPKLMTGGELKPYQLAGIQWLVSLYNNHLNGILADEMGLGKTIQSIGLIAYLMETKHNPGPYLVIAPLSTQKNWRSEFDKWTPSIKVVAYTGNPDQRAALWKTSLRPGTFNVMLISFEYIMNKHDRAKLAAVPWKYIIIDEGHRVKNSQSKLSVTLAERYHAPHRLILSGTPLQNSLIELWSLLNFLLPTIFDSAESFQEWFSKPFEKQGFNAAKDGDAADQLLDEEEKLLIIHRLHTILRPFLLRRMKIDVASQLPPKTEIIVKTSLTSWQQTMYEQIISQVGVQTVDAAGQIKAKKMMNTFMQLRKIVNHPYLFEMTNPDFQSNYVAGPDLIRSSGKFDLLHRMLPKMIQNGHKVLLFTQMTRVLDLIEDLCEWKRIKFVRLDGHCSVQQRSDAQDAFNSPESEIHLFIMSTRAGGLGLNLQVADTVILFDSDWNPQADVQAMDRAHRIGQTKEVRIFRLISLSPVEEQMLARAQEKLKIDQMVIQSGRFDNKTKTTTEERKATLQDILRQDVQLGQTAAPTDEQVNRMMCRSEAEFHIFQRMDKEITKADAEAWTTFSKKPYPGRFITEDELPVHVRHVDLSQLVEDDELDQSQRAARKASSVSYTEALSDREWTSVDPAEYAQQKRARKESAAGDKKKGGSKSKDGDSEDDEDVLAALDSSGTSASESDEPEEEEEDSPEENSDSDASFAGRKAPRRSGAPAAAASSGSKRGRSAAPSASKKKGVASSRAAPTPAKRRAPNNRSGDAMVDDDLLVMDTPTPARNNSTLKPPLAPVASATSNAKRSHKRKSPPTQDTPEPIEEMAAPRAPSRSRRATVEPSASAAAPATPSRSARLSASPSPSPSPSPSSSVTSSRRASASQKRADSQVASASPSPSPSPMPRSSRSSASPAPTPTSQPDAETPQAAKRQRRR